MEYTNKKGPSQKHRGGLFLFKWISEIFFLRMIESYRFSIIFLKRSAFPVF